MSNTWDIALSYAPTGGNSVNPSNFARLGLPVALSRPLIERGYNRAKVTITADGILLTPYHREGSSSPPASPIDLPDWDTP
jgi:hypothetical protein